MTQLEKQQTAIEFKTKMELLEEYKWYNVAL